MQKLHMLQHSRSQLNETSLSANGGKNEDCDGVYGSRTLVEYVWTAPLSIRHQRQQCRTYRCVPNACSSIFSSLSQLCSLIFIEDGRCALQPSALVQSILKLVWACVSAQSAWGPRPVPGLLSPQPPSK